MSTEKFGRTRTVIWSCHINKLTSPRMNCHVREGPRTIWSPISLPWPSAQGCYVLRFNDFSCEISKMSLCLYHSGWGSDFLGEASRKTVTTGKLHWSDAWRKSFLWFFKQRTVSVVTWRNYPMPYQRFFRDSQGGQGWGKVELDIRLASNRITTLSR